MENKSNQGTPAILLKLQALYPSLSKAEQKVVDYVTAHPEAVIHLSVAGLAEASGVSDATVIRACRRLGMKRYQELKLSLAQDIVSPLQSIHEEVEDGDSAATIIDKVFQGAMHTLIFTHDTLKAEAFEQTVESIMNARQIVLFGQGNSHTMCNDLQHKLLRLRIQSHSYPDSHLTSIAVSALQEGDVFFGISHTGSSVEVVEMAKLAKERGATVIAMTMIGRSPLSKVADICLNTASKETEYRVVALNSRMAQMAIIIALYTIIATRIPDAVEGFRNIEKALGSKRC